MTDVVIPVRFPYGIKAGTARSPKETVVAGSASVCVRAVDPGLAPVAYVVERPLDERAEAIYRREHRLAKEAVVPAQRFEYRVVDGALMRGLVGADGVAPLTVAALSAHAAQEPEDGRVRFWRDFPGPNGIRSMFDDFSFAQAQAPDRRKIAEDGRDRALVGVFRATDTCRVVGGALFRPAPPPCWELARLYGTLESRLAVMEYDYPGLLSPAELVGPTSTAFRRSLPFAAFAPERRAEAAAALADIATCAGDRLESEAPPGAFDRDLAFIRLRLLRYHFGLGMQQARWDLIPLRLRGRIAALQDALEDHFVGATSTGAATDAARECLTAMAPLLAPGQAGMDIDPSDLAYMRYAAEVAPATLASTEGWALDDDFNGFDDDAADMGRAP